MINLLQKNKYFFFPALLVLVFWTILVIIFPKGQLHISINQTHTGISDIFFKYITYLGDGWTVLGLTLILLIIKYRYVIIFLISNIFITAFVQVLKKLVFMNCLRPKAYFEGLYNLYLIPGVEVHSQHSFPSGHAATAFAVFTLLALITKNRWLKIIWLIMGIITAYSRVYLSQHFLVDIIAGSIIGMVFTFSTFHYFNIFVPNRLNGSLRHVLKSNDAHDHP